MQPIFDAQGSTVAWLNRDVIHDLDGSSLAFIRNGVVYAYDGEQLGWLHTGFFRDGDGDAVAFMDGCVGDHYILCTNSRLLPRFPTCRLSPLSYITRSAPYLLVAMVCAELGRLYWNRWIAFQCPTRGTQYT